jgi:hypothetical protein
VSDLFASPAHKNPGMFSIRQFALIISLCLMFFSCKKAIQDQKEKYVLSVMTSGRWFLENYTENGNDNTFDFISYQFQFHEDSRLYAITIDSVTNGTWKGDQSTLTMTITFPGGDRTLSRLNHPWLFTKSNIGLVFAEATTASGKKTIRLRKKT